MIDPATAEVNWTYGQTLDPYGTIPDLPEEEGVPVALGSPAAGTVHSAIKANGEVIWNIDLPSDDDFPF